MVEEDPPPDISWTLLESHFYWSVHNGSSDYPVRSNGFLDRLLKEEYKRPGESEEDYLSRIIETGYISGVKKDDGDVCIYVTKGSLGLEFEVIYQDHIRVDSKKGRVSKYDLILHYKRWMKLEDVPFGISFPKPKSLRFRIYQKD